MSLNPYAPPQTWLELGANSRGPAEGIGLFSIRAGGVGG